MSSQFAFVFLVSLCLIKYISGRPHTNENQQPEQDYNWLDNMAWTIPELMGYKQQFEMMDTDKNGVADFTEVRDFLRKVSPNVSNKQVQRYLARRDSNGDNKLEFIPEYLIDVTIPNLTAEDAIEMFQLDDTNQDGVVSFKELEAMMTKLGKSPEEIKSSLGGYYSIVDRNRDRHLDWNEYKQLFVPGPAGPTQKRH